MYTVIDNVLECLTVKLNINNKENIIISSWYRKPGSSIDICIDTLECIFRNTKKNKKIFLCGDFNINLLNQDMHKGTNDFIDQLFSLGLYPLIYRPSRITTSSATLIDNNSQINQIVTLAMVYS